MLGNIMQENQRLTQENERLRQENERLRQENAPSSFLPTASLQTSLPSISSSTPSRLPKLPSSSAPSTYSSAQSKPSFSAPSVCFQSLIPSPFSTASSTYSQSSTLLSFFVPSIDNRDLSSTALDLEKAIFQAYYNGQFDRINELLTDTQISQDERNQIVTDVLTAVQAGKARLIGIQNYGDLLNHFNGINFNGTRIRTEKWMYDVQFMRETFKCNDTTRIIETITQQPENQNKCDVVCTTDGKRSRSYGKSDSLKKFQRKLALTHLIKLEAAINLFFSQPVAPSYSAPVPASTSSSSQPQPIFNSTQLVILSLPPSSSDLPDGNTSNIASSSSPSSFSPPRSISALLSSPMSFNHTSRQAAHLTQPSPSSSSSPSYPQANSDSSSTLGNPQSNPSQPQQPTSGPSSSYSPGGSRRN